MPHTTSPRPLDGLLCVERSTLSREATGRQRDHLAITYLNDKAKPYVQPLAVRGGPGKLNTGKGGRTAPRNLAGSDPRGAGHDEEAYAAHA